jgi:thioredoxin 1
MEITSELLKEKIEKNEKIIVDFYAEWCVPCSRMKPIFEKIAEEQRNNNSEVQMYTMNVEHNQEVARSLGIRSIPTIKGFSEGKETFSKTGLLVETQINELTTMLG